MNGNLRLERGQLVGYRGSDWLIAGGLDLATVWLQDPLGLTKEKARIEDLTAPSISAKWARILQPENLSQRQRESAIRKLGYVKDLANRRCQLQEIAEQARQAGVSVATIYRWRSRFERTGLLSALVPQPKGGVGKSRLTVDQEKAINTAIDEVYLQLQRLPLKAVMSEVEKICKAQGLKAPSRNTLRGRIEHIPTRLKVERRLGRKAARAYEPHPDSFPDPLYPLAVVQIDHTKLDIDLVDDVTRLPIGRPWVTMAIDVFSRIITGYYVSLDPPGDLSTGQCIANSIVTKQQWLRDRGITQDWPCYGVMDSVHLDNAREFRGNTLKYACEQYGIDIHWRPVAQPHFGGHVERLLGTLAKEIHTLPGTTFSRVKDLHEYKHGEMACMTLKEFDVWLANLIVCDYHLRMHTGLKMSPLAKYEEGIFGKGDRPGRGYPPVFTDTRRVELDFLPMFRRSIQVKGVVIDHIHYYHDALRRFIGQKQQFIFKRSPKDISIIHFYDPEQKQYHQIPQRDISRPPMTLWALREIVRGLVREGKKHIDEQVIYANRERRLELVQRASRDTEAARRKLRRLSVNPVRATKPSKALNAKSTPDPVKPDEIVEPYPVRED